ncbi:hypothetical protein PLICRDRAFT_395433 [Plicaturopsis crispa FD-325 SS-3]|nr:hypothetical protein PLICRDRAFT_395433 [Plicaturopsis crispa FD-325 SS-3]
MPAEPIEAEFASPPALSREQEEEFREVGHEGLFLPSDNASSPTHTLANVPTRLKDVERAFSEKGIKIVEFTKGAGEDPREWGKPKKWLVTITTSFLCLAVTLGSSIVTGDLEGPKVDLNTTNEIINLSVTCFVIGFGIGPLLLAPLSEFVGRKPIYCLSIFLYFVFTLPDPLAKNAATLIVSRQIAGLAASAPMCNVGGSVSDVWAVEERGIPMALFSVTIFMGPCIGPIIGGWIGQMAGWRYIYWTLFAFVGACFILTLVIPESYAPVLLKRKAEALRKETGDESYRTLAELEHIGLAEDLKIALTRPFALLFGEAIVFFMSIYLTFVYSLLYLMFFAFPIAFAEIRGFGGGITGTTFVSLIIGIGIAMSLLPLQEKVYRKATKNGTFPEARLYTMMIGAFVLPVSLLIFAFTGAYAHVNFMGPCVGGALFGFAMILLYVSANSYIVDSYSQFAASAIAAKTFLRSEVGASVPLFVEQMFHHMGFQWAGLLLAMVSVLILPMPFFFYKYGAGIRARSAKASKDMRVPDDAKA